MMKPIVIVDGVDHHHGIVPVHERGHDHGAADHDHGHVDDPGRSTVLRTESAHDGAQARGRPAALHGALTTLISDFY